MKKFAILLAMVLAAPIARADLLLEPFLGYYTGELETTSAGTTSTSDTDGMGLGARIGYQQLGLMVGGEFMTGKWKDDSNPSNDVTPTTLGVFIGYNFPVLLRVWGTYNIQTKTKVEGGGTSNDLEGDSLKLAVGTTILPLVSINLEYITSTFDEADGNTLSPEWKAKMYGLSVSLPLTF